MHACTDGPPADHEIRLELRPPVTLLALSLVLADVRRQSRFRARTRFAVDCSAVEDLSPQVLADFARLRGELRKEGSDLTFTGCGAILRMRLDNPLYAPLDADGIGRWTGHGGHTPPGPRFLRLPG